jgi:CheY-like chemotaxis protein
MSWLLIEDDPNKAKQLNDFLAENYPLESVKLCRSYQSGLKNIFEGSYNLVLLDMSLPTFDISPEEDGYAHKQLAGQEILRELKRKRKIIKTIVVTQFESFGDTASSLSLDALKQKLKDMFPENYIGTVYYNASQSQWKKDLKIMLDKVNS